MEDLNPGAASQGEVPARKRRRPALSCAECRRRKVKCNRTRPCDPCKQLNLPTCTYSPEGLSSLRKSVAQSPLSTSLSSADADAAKAFNGALVSRAADADGSDSLEVISDDTATTSAQSFTEIRSNETGNADQELARRIGRLEQILASSHINEQEIETVKQRKTPARGLMTKNRYFGPSHWMSAIVEAQSFMCFEFNLNDPNDDDDSIKLTNMDAALAFTSILNSCKVMTRAIKAAREPQWSIWGTTFQHSVPPRDVADELIGHYFRTHESTHRILHIPSFQKEYTQYWTSPQTTPTVSLIKILLVMAIGTCFYQGSDFDTHKTRAVQWCYIAQSWLASPREKTRLHTATLQVECLLLLARSIYNISADLLWNHTGSVVRTAMSMGFHREPKYSKHYSILHKEIRRRLWATILEINIQTSLSHGVSPMISVDDYDTEVPSNINDDEMDETTSTHPVSHPAHVFTQSSIQIALQRSLPTRLEVANLVNVYRIESSYEDVIRLDKDLVQIYKNDRLFLAGAAQDDSGILRPTSFHRKMLDLLVQRFLLILHRPFAVRAHTNPRFYYSHKVYLDTAVAVHSLPSHIKSSTLNSDINDAESDYQRFRLISGGFIKEIFIHSVIIIYQEMLRPLEDDFLALNSEESRSSREPYLRLLRDMVDLSHKRIEAGETAVKSHLMYSIALAHIEALEDGTSAEEAMIEAAKANLAQCKEILKHKTLFLPNLDDFADRTDQTQGLPAGDTDMRDWGVEFEPSDSWLFSGWPLGNAKGDFSF